MRKMLGRVRRLAEVVGLIGVSLLLQLMLVASTIGQMATIRRKKHGMTRPDTKRASIIIPTWNGRDLLDWCLKSLYEDIERDGVSHEVVVVDNGSTDGSLEMAREKYPSTRLVALDRNYGFARAANEGVRKSTCDVVVLLNNDMAVEEGFIRNLLNRFTDSDIFAVSSQILFDDPRKRREETGRTLARFVRGYMWLGHSERKSAWPGPALYAGGGSSAYDRAKFLDLGCFDEMYRPFYVEDVDISFRAWMRGWRTLYEPSSVVHHRHQATIGSRFSREFVEKVRFKNQLLFQWKVLQGWQLLEHCIFLPALVVKGRIPAASVKMALTQIDECMRGRIREAKRRVFSNREILNLTYYNFHYRERFGSPNPARGRKRRVLFVCPYVPGRGHHGGATRMFEIIRHMSKRNKVSVLAMWRDSYEKDLARELSEFGVKLATVWRGRNLSFRNILRNGFSSFLDFYEPRMHRALLDVLDEEFDIVQYEMSQMAQYAVRSQRMKQLLVLHELNFLREKTRFHRSNWLHKLPAVLRWLSSMDIELGSLGKFDAVIVLNDEERREIQAFFPEANVDVVGIGVDAKLFKPRMKLKEDENTLLFSGWFRHPPNVEAAVFFCKEILPLIRAERPSVKFSVVGGDPPPEVQVLASISNVEVKGYVRDLRPQIARTAVYVAPIVTGGGVRVKVLEAWAMGKAVVSTSLGCQGLDGRDGWNVAIADEPAEFARKSIELLKNGVLRRQLGANARKTIEEKYDWRKLIDHHERIYDRVLTVK